MDSLFGREYILSKLKELKPKFESDGVNILGLFGSYARNEENSSSDIDILIETTPIFMTKYRGLKAYVKLEEIKNILEKNFHKKIDIVDKNGLLQHKNTYILNQAIYV
ncbi:nucleotidyltransferase family protein [Arcobacter sp. FWKO B]|uniref:nucleotidyltransferase family protein n=1 Tax=Arcobacter sp. FWKO B TaxID=2593672 RepID=UPI0018A4E45D|nr:nucleotidyltransferase domain-containing protein [Arcobacter sp. FWKO B]QOG12929.1 nucleotidyltransferase [Arcobacter sp. FWKO B]